MTPKLRLTPKETSKSKADGANSYKMSWDLGLYDCDPRGVHLKDPPSYKFAKKGGFLEKFALFFQ